MIELVLILVVLGVALYLLEKFVPMDPVIIIVIRVVVVICAVLFLLRAFGVGDVPIPRLR